MWISVARAGTGTIDRAYLNRHSIDLATGKKRWQCPGHKLGVTALQFHPDGKHLLSAGRDTTVRIWNAADGKLVKTLGQSRGGQFNDWLYDMALSPDGKWLATADMGGFVHVWKLFE
jgi:WD40 repeat protein